jgi:hypothetical protein
VKLNVTAIAGLIVSVSAAALSVTPAAARSLAETHVEVHQPGGKTPTRLYRQISRDTCAVAPRHTPAGKLPRAHAPATSAECDEQIARARLNKQSATASTN